MMIFLFSQSRAAFLGSEALVLLFALARIYDGGSLASALFLFALGSLLCVLTASLYAVLLHHRLLLVLYSLQRPADFIRLYAPLLACRPVPSNVRFTLAAYLSNGYAAQGDFEQARAQLDAAPATRIRQALSRELILCGNRASIALMEGCADEAALQLEKMAQLMHGGRLSAKKRAAQQAILNTQSAQLRILRGECTAADCAALREESKKPGSPLRKTELNYFIGRAYAALGETGFAREYLTQAAQNRDVCCGRLAACALRSLPGDRNPGVKKKK